MGCSWTPAAGFCGHQTGSRERFSYAQATTSSCSAAMVRSTHAGIIDQVLCFAISARGLIEHRFGRHLRLHGLEGHFVRLVSYHGIAIFPYAGIRLSHACAMRCFRSGQLRSGLNLQLQALAMCTFKQARCAVQLNGAVCMHLCWDAVATPSGP